MKIINRIKTFFSKICFHDWYPDTLVWSKLSLEYPHTHEDWLEHDKLKWRRGRACKKCKKEQVLALIWTRIKYYDAFS